MDRASEELERRSRYLSSLVRRTKLADPPEPEPEPEREREVVPRVAAEPSDGEGIKGGKVMEEGVVVKAAKAPAKGETGNGEERKVAVRVRAADMPPALQRRAIRVALEATAAMRRIDNKRLALALKKEFDTTYGPAWHCIVGTSFGSYVTHSLGGFLYLSVDNVYILLFRTAVEPLSYPR
uniref:Dynein light chain n=1 Tax=Leersia perrieri TaxID=77586 RepID=A0A0D9W5V5_9ORYZ